MNGRRILLLSLILALIATISFSIYIRPSESTSASVGTVEVMVATKDIPKNTTINKDMLTKKNVPKDVVPVGVETRPEQVIGKIAVENINANEPFVSNRLLDPNSDMAMLTYKIPKGKRAITLAYNDVMGVAGFIRPGDRVDVIGTFDPDIMKQTINQDISKVLLQNIQVLAVGSKKADGAKSDTPENAPLATITLAATPEEAELLTFTEERGSVRLLLRGVEEDSKVNTLGTSNSNLLIPRK
jgi:pilus assembly protein CpaB